MYACICVRSYGICVSVCLIVFVIFNFVCCICRRLLLYMRRCMFVTSFVCKGKYDFVQEKMTSVLVTGLPPGLCCRHCTRRPSWYRGAWCCSLAPQSLSPTQTFLKQVPVLKKIQTEPILNNPRCPPLENISLRIWHISKHIWQNILSIECRAIMHPGHQIYNEL